MLSAHGHAHWKFNNYRVSRILRLRVLEGGAVDSLLTLKINVDESCFNYEPPEEMLKVNKTAVRQYNEAHGSYNNN